MTEPVSIQQVDDWVKHRPEAKSIKWVVPFIDTHAVKVVRIEAPPYTADVDEAFEGDLLELLSYKITNDKQGSPKLNYRTQRLLTTP